MNKFGMCTAETVLSSLRGLYFGFSGCRGKLLRGVALIMDVKKNTLRFRLRTCQCPRHNGKAGSHALSVKDVIISLDFDRDSTPSLVLSVDANTDAGKFFAAYSERDKENETAIAGYLFLQEQDARRYCRL